MFFLLKINLSVVLGASGGHDRECQWYLFRDVYKPNISEIRNQEWFNEDATNMHTTEYSLKRTKHITL